MESNQNKVQSSQIEILDNHRFEFGKTDMLSMSTNQYKTLMREEENIVIARAVKFQDGLNIVNYLVNQMEGKKYIKEKKTFVLKEEIDKNKFVERMFTIHYLCLEENKLEAFKEVKRYFLFNPTSSAKDIDGLSFLKVAFYYDNKSPKYIDYHVIDTDYNKFYTDYFTVHGKECPVLIDTICDERFGYINDFMNYVLEYKIEKSEMETENILEPVNYEQLKLLADQFVDKYKNDNKHELILNYARF